MRISATVAAAALILTASASAQQLKVTGRNYVAASGHWRSDAETPRPEEQKNQVKIECDKNISLCAVAEGSNLMGPGNLFTRLDVTPVHYTILQWDDSGVVAQTLARNCVINRLVIDLHTRKVTMVETPKSGAEDGEACKAFTKVVTSQLVSP
jgi:hypothetical protein